MSASNEIAASVVSKCGAGLRLSDNAATRTAGKPSGYYEHPRREVLGLIPVDTKRLLDVGCGKGVLGAAAKAAGAAEVHGIELMVEIAAVAAERLDHVWSGAVEAALPLVPDGHYDCIVIADVLEHLLDPLAVLRTLSDKLAPGGVIVASIPNVQNWGVLSALIEGRFEYAPDGILDRTHLRFFTRRSVEELFWGAGLCIETMDTTVRGPHLPERLSTDIELAGLDPESLCRDARTWQFLVRAQRPKVMEPRVTAIVLNWNGRDDTLRCLTSLKHLDYSNLEIVVVDNGSDDDSVFVIQRAFPDIYIIETGVNLGYAGGNNVGIRWALARKTEYVLVLNNDTIVAPDFLKALCRNASILPKRSVIGCAMLFDDRPDTIWMLGGVWDRSSGRFLYDGANRLLSEYVDIVREVDYVVGCALAVPSSVLQEIGLLDEEYFLHYEEIDFCTRARKYGIRCFVGTNAKLWHKVAASFGGDESPMAEYFRTRNKLLWARRHLTVQDARQVYSQVWRRLWGTIFPSRCFSGVNIFEPRLSYWKIISWARSTRIKISSSSNKAFFSGVRDHYLKRYGDCPSYIRRLKA